MGDYPLIRCEIHNARLTLAACEANCKAASRAVRLLNAGLPMELIDDIDLQRMVTCGRCEYNTRADPEFVKHAVKIWIGRMHDKLEQMERDWDVHDPDVMRGNRLAAWKRHREQRREERAEKKRQYRLLHWDTYDRRQKKRRLEDVKVAKEESDEERGDEIRREETDDND